MVTLRSWSAPTLRFTPGTGATCEEVWVSCPDPQALRPPTTTMPASRDVAARRRGLLRRAVTTGLLDQRRTGYSLTAPRTATPQAPLPPGRGYPAQTPAVNRPRRTRTRGGQTVWTR